LKPDISPIATDFFPFALRAVAAILV
jgi:hypothetical protein